MIGGHGHVTPRPDGQKARCGGPKICKECAVEQVTVLTAAAEPEVTKVPLDGLSDLVKQFETARDLEAQAKAKKEEYRAMIAAYLEDQGAEYGTIKGRLAVRWREINATKWDGKRFKADHPELAAQYTVENPYMKMEMITP